MSKQRCTCSRSRIKPDGTCLECGGRLLSSRDSQTLARIGQQLREDLAREKALKEHARTGGAVMASEPQTNLASSAIAGGKRLDPMQRIDPSMPREVAQRIFWQEYGDLKARWMMNNLAEKLFNSGSAPSKRASATLIHACAYLEDRIIYELSPWPKNMIKLPFERCKHGTANAEPTADSGTQDANKNAIANAQPASEQTKSKERL